MHGPDLLTLAVVYLAAAVLTVPVARRLGLGSVLGYLAAGVVIGPFGLDLAGGERDQVMHVAEFGVVMMLFLVGLELEPALLWRMRGPLFGLGGLQVGVTALVFAAAALPFGIGWPAALAIGFVFAMSSTAIVLPSLAERDRMRTPAGQHALAVLLFQDVAVIPVLALFPLLAGFAGTTGGATAESAHGAGALAAMPGWQRALGVLAAVAAIVLAGRVVVQPLLRMIARTRSRELFTAASLLLVFALAKLMTLVGLSPALGTFLGGVVLAGSEYRHELVSDVEPFKGLLLGIFFTAVGASIDFGFVAAWPWLAAGLVLGVAALKFVLLFGLSRAFKLGAAEASVFAAALAHVGEFAFVLIGFAATLGLFAAHVAGALVATVALGMALAPVAMAAVDRVVLPRFAGAKTAPARAADTIEEQNPVIVAGFGRFGQIVARLLRAHGIGATVLEIDADRIDLLRRFGQRAFYGDASRLDLLHAAGAESAKLIVLAIDTPQTRLEMVHTVRRHFPHLEILARADDMVDAQDLVRAGVTHVYRETLDASLRLAADALRLSGMRAYRAQRAARLFLRHDEETVRRLAALDLEERLAASYVSAARERIADLERVMREDLSAAELARDAGWDPESLRDDVRGGTFPVPETGDGRAS